MAIAIPPVFAAPRVSAGQTQPTTNPTHELGDIAGDWQGTLDMGRSTRVVVRIARGHKGWAANFEAIQQQIGLKLDAEKTAADVIVIDHLEKPSAN